MVGVAAKSEETDDGIGVQQLGHAVRGALIAFEVEATLLALAGRNQDHAAVGDQAVEDRQRIGGRDAGALTVAHGARHTDKRDALESRSSGRSAVAAAPVCP